MRRAYVALIELLTVFSVAWYKIVILVVYHAISHLSLVHSWYTHSPKDLCVSATIQVTSGISHGIPRERVASVVCISYQIDVSFSCGCPVIDHEFRHNIVKVAADPRGNSRFDNSLSITGQTHEKLTSICLLP